MKNWNWKQWTALALAAALIIAVVVLHFVQPVVSFAFTEFATLIGAIIGGVCGYSLHDFLNKKQ